MALKLVLLSGKAVEKLDKKFDNLIIQFKKTFLS